MKNRELILPRNVPAQNFQSNPLLYSERARGRLDGRRLVAVVVTVLSVSSLIIFSVLWTVSVLALPVLSGKVRGKVRG